MLFCLIGTDKPDALAIRLANREAHVKYWKESGRIAAGGPFTSDDGAAMNGSLLAIEAADRAEVERLAAEDPYTKAGLFERVEIRAWKWVLNPR
ncbi:MAG: YciI family protein [Parvibaculum sp.]|uniref:YciI family protein n=1 Tax=Parvibaculum sp. TaxID=2024848 RepID=UPI00283D18F4|nr:YciI family protein [Parvibaculum sp.]MDR3498449.1 YciI family protein [Parvibaculum sp.]